MKEEMLKAVKEVNKNSYSPYSSYRVSACLYLEDGTLITGVNVENASYGLTICAERCALFKAYSEGVRKDDIKAIMIYTNRNDSMPYPCGACRQVMSELMNTSCPVYVVNDNDKIEEYSIESLLPQIFTKENL